MESTLINQGVTLMLYGMGTVFVFLTILVFATQAMSALANRFASAEQPVTNTNKSAQPSPLNANVPTANANQPSPIIVAAIEKAIATHRAKNRS